MARTYLSSHCTSVDSERLFSSAAHILTEERNRLEPKKAEMLLFIKKNLRVGSNAKKEHYKAMRPTYFSILNLRTLCCVTLWGLLISLFRIYALYAGLRFQAYLFFYFESAKKMGFFYCAIAFLEAVPLPHLVICYRPTAFSNATQRLCIVGLILFSFFQGNVLHNSNRWWWLLL